MDKKSFTEQKRIITKTTELLTLVTELKNIWGNERTPKGLRNAF